MGSTKKGTTWHFGLKAHVGSDPQGRVHSKHLWGYRKVRYRGLAKNAAQIFTLFALANFYLARHELRST